MNAQYDAFVTVALLIVLVLFIRGPWRSVCTDYARQVIFEHRDAVFDLAADGALRFDDPNYRVIRAALERNIRFAHEISIVRFIFMMRWIARRPEILQRKSGLELAIESIADEKLRKTVARHVYLGQRALIVLMLVKSPLAIVFGLIMALLASFVTGVGRWTRKTLRVVARDVQAEADITPDTFHFKRAA